jgi:hypothetical protein
VTAPETAPAERHMGEGQQQSAEAIVHPVERTLHYLRRVSRRALARDTGDLLGIGQIKQMLGTKDGDAVRGYLIKLVARGDVEVLECTNGIYWRSTLGREILQQRIQEVEKVDGHFILQREIMDDHRGLWFDAEKFTNSKRAARALEYAQREAYARANEWGTPAKRVQSIRLISQVQP